MAAEIKKCVIVSGAPCDNPNFIKSKVDDNAFVIAADSGYRVLIDAGIIPNVIIGDFDSADKPNLDCKIVKLPCEKAYCDTFECVQYAVNNGFKDILLLNAIGSRVDHTYANILSLNFCKKHDVKCIIENEKNRLSLINNKAVIKKEYDNFSLFAYLEDCIGVKIKGAYYTAGFYDKNELDIMQGDQFAVSNYVCDDECEISLKSGTLLLIESND